MLKPLKSGTAILALSIGLALTCPLPALAQTAETAPAALTVEVGRTEAQVWPDQLAVSGRLVPWQEGVVASSEAIRCWAVLATHRKAPKMPTDLLDEICNRIALRQEPGLHSVVASVARIVREAPKQLSTSQIDALCRGLEY